MKVLEDSPQESHSQIVVPVLGHANWHLYLKMVAR